MTLRISKILTLNERPPTFAGGHPTGYTRRERTTRLYGFELKIQGRPVKLYPMNSLFHCLRPDAVIHAKSFLPTFSRASSD
jgi:hypothetical protein